MKILNIPKIEMEEDGDGRNGGVWGVAPWGTGGYLVVDQAGRLR